MEGAAWVQTLHRQNKDEFLRVALLADFSGTIDSNQSLFFPCSVGSQAKARSPQRLAQPLDLDFHNALVHAGVGLIAMGSIVCQLKDMSFQTAVSGDNIRDGTEVHRSFSQ
jgi:hypothetical protein